MGWLQSTPILSSLFLNFPSSLISAWAVPSEKTSYQSAFLVLCAISGLLFWAAPPCNEWGYLKEACGKKFYSIFSSLGSRIFCIFAHSVFCAYYACFTQTAQLGIFRGFEPSTSKLLSHSFATTIALLKLPFGPMKIWNMSCRVGQKFTLSTVFALRLLS